MKSARAILVLACAFFVCGVTGSHAATGEEHPHWSFQRVKRPIVPRVDESNPIDAFISARLSEERLVRNPPASRRELIRRASFDLIGVPPTPAEVAAFESDRSPEPFEKVVDRLLASPQYGERWGRHWLDLVRFAQSNGYERDGEKLLAWRYRDYVINSFNADKRYDRFIVEQLAGDELPDGTAESVVATAFQRLGVFDDEPDDKRMAEFDGLDDVLSTTGVTFLGLTLGCARCHDHKFDPIPQSEYYSLLAFFRGVRPFESTPPNFDSPGFAPLAAAEEIKHWRAWKNAQLKSLEERRASATDEKRKKEIEAEIKKTKEDVPYEWTLAVRENGRECPATHILTRGNAATPSREVQPAFPKCLTDKVQKVPDVPADASSSGRRRVLAEWIASADNPLTARVMVNRIWQHHFGEAIVKTTTDFGHAGARPSHPELLDWLAAEFVDNGWSVKKLHRMIMLSATYRQSSRADNGRGQTVDPGNRFLWRQNLRRLEAEALRDTVLSISGSLNTKMGGRGFFPHLAGEVIAGESRPGLDWDVSTAGEQSRRSVYAFIRRTMGVPLFETFDYSNTTSPLAERPTTTVAPQALMLLNDTFMQEQASAFAARICAEAGPDLTAQARRAYAIAFSRAPSDAELKTALAFVHRNQQAFCALASRNSFEPGVANALSTDYFAKLAPSQFLIGPHEDWSYYRGGWAPPYEGIRAAVREQTPFALWNGARFQDGSIEAGVLLSNSSEFASILFRARAEGDLARGYELVFRPREQRAELRRHSDTMATLARAEVQLPIGTPFHLRVEMHGARIQVWISENPRPLFELNDEKPLSVAGQIGVRAWGGSLILDKVRVQGSASTEAKEVPGSDPDASHRALESFCLLLFNLNELIYVE